MAEDWQIILILGSLTVCSLALSAWLCWRERTIICPACQRRTATDTVDTEGHRRWWCPRCRHWLRNEVYKKVPADRTAR